ncbi:MAG: hypothetical protein CR997_02400 [Acidobacteria bacterium]|nr:MAG: hypothetical protein CR997_02400 [Acidobacteriota bacterium]
MKLAGKIAIFLILILFLFVLAAVVYNRFPEKSARLNQWNKVEQKREDDHLFERLENIGSRVNFEDRTTYDPLGMSENELNMILLQNGSALASFYALYHRDYTGVLTIESNHSRTYRLESHSDPVPNYRPWQNLVRLLILQAHHHFINEREEQGLEALGAASQLIQAMLQNPSMIELIMGLYQSNELNKYLVQSGRLYPEICLSWIPDPAFIIESLDQALYCEFLLMENMIESGETLQSMKSDQLGSAAVLFFNKEQSIGFLIENYRKHHQCLEKSLLVQPQREPHFSKTNPWHWFSNPIGRILLDVGMPSFNSVNMNACLSIWMADATRLVLIRRNRHLEAGKDTTQALVKELNLVNPYGYQPYQVDQSGKLILLPKDDPLWKTFSVKQLSSLSAFPVVVPYPHPDDQRG